MGISLSKDAGRHNEPFWKVIIGQPIIDACRSPCFGV
nr:MAG TPA: hypothetical protein [Microviridae sp.]